MKKRWNSISIFILLLAIFFVINANAALVDNGDGTVSDTDKNMMWLKDANYAATSGYDSDGLMNWNNAQTWANNLVYANYDDWRLPATVDGPWSNGYDGSTTQGYNITTSEMGHMYYSELSNKGWLDTSGHHPVDYGLRNRGPFINLQNNVYWSGTEAILVWGLSGLAWTFDFRGGYQTDTGKINDVYAWAVRDCGGPCLTPPVVPEPISSILFITGGTLLAGRRYIRRKA